MLANNRTIEFLRKPQILREDSQSKMKADTLPPLFVIEYWYNLIPYHLWDLKKPVLDPIELFFVKRKFENSF